MHRLFTRQLTQARGDTGEVDLDRLGELVSSAYSELERDRRRTDRSISLMIEELDQLNRGLERLVAERTGVLRQREGELEAQNLRFDAAVNNMSQALLMFDETASLVIFNDRYFEMYRLPRDAAQPGFGLLELIERRVQNGTFGGEARAYAETLQTAIRRGRSLSQFIELPDGRTIAELIRPMPGGGWVATHEDVTEGRAAEKKIAHMARYDAMTDLPNRVLFRESLAEAVQDLPAGEALAVLHLDLDQFKAINDTLGHAVGDDLLRVVAARLRDTVDKQDTVARIGGDEFAILHSGVRLPTETAALAHRIVDAIREPCNLQGHTVTVEASVGISIAPTDSVDPTDLLKNAELALDQAKAEGGGTFRFFEPEMDASVKARRTLERELRQALAAGEFELYFQPIVNLASGRISCCEALIRWNHPERGVVLPSEFIPVAEELGLIVPIGEWVIRQATIEASQWPSDMRIAINLSPIQLQSPRLAPAIVAALAATDVAASRLDIEITESVLIENTPGALATLHALRRLGASISMDDFGTGYSSLSYLRSFPFDRIKIDRSFVSGLPESEDAVAIVRAVAGLARTLKIGTTAEGVETAAQMEEVRLLGCTEMQGFYFSPPVRAEEMALILAGETVRFARSA